MPTSTIAVSGQTTLVMMVKAIYRVISYLDTVFDSLIDGPLLDVGDDKNSDDLTRFNKIAIPNNKFQMASGQGSHWLIESPTIFSSMCSPPLSNICQFYF